MTVKELIKRLEKMPPLNEVYIQTHETALQKCEKVERMDKLGSVWLTWRNKK